MISIGSIGKTMSLSSGGRAVAELLDGRLVNPSSIDLHERKLLNIVEEMAIASGVPVPQVYVMDDETSINAFAAGHSASDAAISVTRGCMTMLSRDELQGVIAHEFSHLLNGDMRLNLRLMGLIFGILCLTVIGRVLIHTRGKKNPLPLLGLALIIIGWVGVLFGRLIQAAVSRQREFLADASAVQFTRNPGGLAGALKKIGGLSEGSKLAIAARRRSQSLVFRERSAEFVLWFRHASAFGRTHPGFGPGASMEIFRASRSKRSIPPPRRLHHRRRGAQPPPLPGAQPPPLPSVQPPPLPIAMAALAPAVIAQQAIVADIGQPTTEHLRYAAELQQSLPDSLRTCGPRSARRAARWFARSCSIRDQAAREKQLEELGRATSEAMRQETLRIWPEVQSLPPQARLPLVDIALPALRRLSPPQFEQFRAAVKTLVASDSKTDLFEYMLQKIVMRHLETRFFPTGRSVTQFYDLRPLAHDAGVLLSATAYAGHARSGAGPRCLCSGRRDLGPHRPPRNPMAAARPMRTLSPRRRARALQPGGAADQKKCPQCLRPNRRRRRRHPAARSRAPPRRR